MNRMVKNLLTLNQLEFGTDEVEFERFDIVKLVKGVIASCDILFQQVNANVCLLYTSDAADEEDSVDLGGCRIIKKKNMTSQHVRI